MTPARVSAVVLSRDLDALLRTCLRSLARAAEVAACELSVVVVDNSSRAPCPHAFADAPRFRLLRFDAHHSFGFGCNAGARLIDADAFLFLNNDALLDPRALADMLAVLAAHPRTGICGTRLVFPDDTIQHAGVVFGPGDQGPYHIHRRRPTAVVPRAAAPFQAVTGACMLVRRDLFAALGGFDEAFPFGLEDVDLCLRAGSSGCEIRCAQGTDSLHFESLTPGRVELDVPSRRMLMERWKGRYTVDG